MVNEPKRNILEGIENTGDVHLHDHRLRLKQRFDIIRKLGQGTYGKVQLGINKKTGQEVAIKTIKKCKIETEADLVRLRREVQIMSSVRHPNIIHIYEVFENSEKMILVMEYCSGGELYDYLSERKVLQEDEARRLFRQIATAVYYCHKHKICHRDLKLENVLLDEHGSAKIADFGLSNVFEEKRLLSTFCGSPLYASPEIVKGTPYIGPEVDCWSLGVLLYTLVYGAMPFDGSNFKRLVKQISTGDYFEPKNPSSASPLIRDMLTVDPIQRADITHICDHPWVNKGSDVACLELAEALANETPVRLDLLLSLAPPPVSDKLVVTDEATIAGPDGSPGRSMSVATVDASAERRILEMVAEGGTDAIKPSPTRTIMGAEQPKRKLETAVSLDNAPSQRKKERFLRSSSKVDSIGTAQQNDIMISPVENNNHTQEVQKDVSMVEQNNLAECVQPKSPSPVQKVLKTPTKEIVKPAAETVEPEPENIVPNQTTNNHVGSVSPTKTSVVNSQAKKETPSKTTDTKPRDTILKEKNSVTKPAVVKKKVTSVTAKGDDKKVGKPKEKSPPRKSLEKEGSAKKTTGGEDNKTDIKQPTERRKSRILDAAEKLNNLTIQPGPVQPQPVASPPATKPKKVLIPGVSVGSFKEQFERRASLTSSVPPVLDKKTGLKSPPGKTLADKKMHSVDSEHPPMAVAPQPKPVTETHSVKLQHIGIEPPQQAEIIIPAQPDSPKKPPMPASEPPTLAIISSNNNKISKPLHKSESLRETSVKREPLANTLSLEDARKSLQHSIALLSQAKGDGHMKPIQSPVEDSGSGNVMNTEVERQTKLKAAREIISNAIGDDNTTAANKKVQRICMGGKPPVPYGASGRSASGSLNLGALGGGSPPLTPPKTYRTEVQHKMEDVRNKFLPTSRGGSIERIIPIHFTSEAPAQSKPQPPVHQQTSQLPYQRNNTMPYRLNSVPRSTSVHHESDRESSQPPTPFAVESPKAEPIKKSPREFIIPIAVEGVGYVTPRQGSLEPSDTPTKLPSSNMPFGPRFSKPRRFGSMVSGGESEDEDDMHMHRLRSSRRTRADPEKESLSSGEEDEDDEGFELLTAENLFSTLLDRVRNLTNRLNGEEGTGFPQRHQSLFNNLHSPFFNSPHLPRKHNKHSLIRDGPSWRRSTSRDMATDFDSMFPSHTTFPRGSRRSSRKGTKRSEDQQQQQTQHTTSEQHNGDTTTTPDTQYSNDHLDLSDLDLSKIELTEKEMETLSGLTPGLSRRLQRQLLSRLPPAAARSLRRTLSAHLPPNHRPHIYSRSLSASKTDPLSCTSPIEDENSYELTSHKNHIMEDDEESSISYNSAKSYTDREIKEPFDKYSDVSDVNSVNHDRSYHSAYAAEQSKSPSVSDRQTTPLSSMKQTPDRSVLGKFLSPERIATEKYPLSNSDYEYSSLLPESNYGYGNGNSASSIPLGGSLRRRSLRTPPIENGHRRISRFLRPDFFDTPREESIYVKEKRDKELETQKVLKEIRQKKLRSTDSPTSSSTYTDVTNLFEPSSYSRNSASPIHSSGRDKSRSITPFHPSLDDISENHTNNSYRNAITDINKHCTDNNNSSLQHRESQIVRPKSYPSKPCDNIYIQNVDVDNNNKIIENEKVPPPKPVTIMESKLLRPKSYPSTSPSPEKFTGILPKPKIEVNPESNANSTNNDSSQSEDFDKQNITVSFNVSIPAKNKINANVDKVNNNMAPKPVIDAPLQNGDVSKNHNAVMSKVSVDVNKNLENNSDNIKVTKTSNVTSEAKISPGKEIPVVKNNSAIVKKSILTPTVETNLKSPVVKPEDTVVTNVKDEKSNGSQSSPPKDTDKNTGEEKKKKTVIKKKIVVKKKVVKKTDPNKSPEKSVGNEEQQQTPTVEKDQKVVDEKEKTVATKKKSVLSSIGEKLEKFRADSFSRAMSQDREIVNEAREKDKTTPAKEEKPSRIENVIRALRERSVPNNNQEEQVTESGLIKRAITITDLPTLEAKTSTSKRTVNKVLGLFKKTDSKTNISIDSNGVENNLTNDSKDLALDKPKRPTSLLLNGIGRRVQACYNGATSDSILVNEGNQFNREKTPVNSTKGDEAKSQKKGGLRLDFSKLPRLNQSIFNKRNSQELSKSRESSVCKDLNNGKPDEVINNNEVSNNNPETPITPYLDTNANNTTSSVMSPNWSPDYDCSNFMVDSPLDLEANHSENHLPHRNHEATSPDPENIEDRIRRRSFYSRFNEKKNKRKSLLVGPGAKEYNPTERIHGHTDNENNVYYNRYDFSPTSSTKSERIGDVSKYSDKNECLSPTSSSKYKSGSDTISSPYSYKSLDRNDQKYLLDPPSQYSNPRYSRTMSMHDSYDSKIPSTDTKKNSARYGRSFSLLSPGNYNTYNPRSRNSAILLRDDMETEPYTTDSILTKIRNRKKLISPSTDDEDYLDTKYRSNMHTTSNQQCDSSDDKLES